MYQHTYLKNILYQTIFNFESTKDWYQVCNSIPTQLAENQRLWKIIAYSLGVFEKVKKN